MGAGPNSSGDESIISTCPLVHHNQKFAGQGSLRIKPDRQQFAEIALLDHFRFRDRLQYSLTLMSHFRMATDDVLLPFIGQANRNTIVRIYDQHEFSRWRKK